MLKDVIISLFENYVIEIHGIWKFVDFVKFVQNDIRKFYRKKNAIEKVITKSQKKKTNSNYQNQLFHSI